MKNPVPLQFSKPVKLPDSSAQNFSRKALSLEFIFCMAVFLGRVTQWIKALRLELYGSWFELHQTLSLIQGHNLATRLLGQNREKQGKGTYKNNKMKYNLLVSFDILNLKFVCEMHFFVILTCFSHVQFSIISLITFFS